MCPCGGQVATQVLGQDEVDIILGGGGGGAVLVVSLLTTEIISELDLSEQLGGTNDMREGGGGQGARYWEGFQDMHTICMQTNAATLSQHQCGHGTHGDGLARATAVLVWILCK